MKQTVRLWTKRIIHSCSSVFVLFVDLCILIVSERVGSYENHRCSLFALLEPRSKCLKKRKLYFCNFKYGFYAWFLMCCVYQNCIAWHLTCIAPCGRHLRECVCVCIFFNINTYLSLSLCHQVIFHTCAYNNEPCLSFDHLWITINTAGM